MPLPDVVSGLLLSGRPLVRIQFGVPRGRGICFAATSFLSPCVGLLPLLSASHCLVSRACGGACRTLPIFAGQPSPAASFPTLNSAFTSLRSRAFRIWNIFPCVFRTLAFFRILSYNETTSFWKVLPKNYRI